MAVLKIADARKLSDKERTEKLKELRIELIKGSAASNKAKAKTKEIKRAIARLLTLNRKVEGGSKK
jgi:ribosomal protein L29